MTAALYTATIPVFRQMLGAMKACLAKAEAHAEARKIEPDALLQARLFPDQFPLLRQVLIACDFAKGAAARLAGVEVPSYTDEERSFADLYARIDKTLAFIESVPAAQFEGSEVREIVTQPGKPRERRFTGVDYVNHYTLPQFYFHVTTAYAILRHNGVEVGKRDYIGSF